MATLKQNLIRYIDARFPIIYLDTYEELKLDEIIKSISYGRKIVEWNGANGFVNFDTKLTALLDSDSLNIVDSLGYTLNFLDKSRDLDNSLFVIKDAHSLLNDLGIVSKLKSLAIKINAGLIDSTIIIVSSIVNIPKELEKFITVLEMDYLSKKEIEKVIMSFIKENEMPAIKDELLEEMAVKFKGLTKYEIENIIALAYAENGELNKTDISLIFEQKRQIIKKSGILEMIPLKESINDIGGLLKLKNWLIKKSKVFKNLDKALEFGVDMPKGVLIVGIPGCGKSLNEKAIANLIEAPLLRMDMGRLMGKYVGESEANMRKAILMAESISPCVLWVDELEKAFAGVGSNGGASDIVTRLFGNFLTWMQEKDSPTFVVATANDVTKLPPELLRKGRFDEVFFVGLPNLDDRKKIFDIHIQKRRPDDKNNINLDLLASKTDGYTGADIENVIIESVENVFSEGKNRLTTEDITKVINETSSLSVIMKESIDSMTEEYKKRKFKNASM
ncbi:MAG: AAA family ATPase [Intestinibacter sp.]